MSFSSGLLVEPHYLTFGREKDLQGDFASRDPDGIMGLGRGQLSIIDRFVKKGVVDDAFSLCYRGIDMDEGVMVLGGISPSTDMVFTFSDPIRSPYYNITLKQLHVAGKPLMLDPKIFDGKHGTVLDSGTSYAYLPEPAFVAFKAADCEGGPVVTESGEVIGIGFVDCAGFAHLLLSYSILPVLITWKHTGCIMNPWFGLTVILANNVLRDTMEVMGISSDNMGQYGATVSKTGLFWIHWLISLKYVTGDRVISFGECKVFESIQCFEQLLELSRLMSSYPDHSNCTHRLPFKAPSKRLKKISKLPECSLHHLNEVVLSGLVDIPDVIDFLTHLLSKAEVIKTEDICCRKNLRV